MSRKNGSECSGYARSRYNRLSYGTHVEGILPCGGRGRCPHNYCDEDWPSSSVGSPCSWEVEFAARLREDFMGRWSALAIMPDVEELDDLAEEAVNIALQRSRTMTRLNRSTTMMGLGREHWEKAAKESELANLYLDRLNQRERRLQAKLDEGMERMRLRAEKLRGGKLWQIEQYLEATRLLRYSASHD